MLKTGIDPETEPCCEIANSSLSVLFMRILTGIWSTVFDRSQASLIVGPKV